MSNILYSLSDLLPNIFDLVHEHNYFSEHLLMHSKASTKGLNGTCDFRLLPMFEGLILVLRVLVVNNRGDLVWPMYFASAFVLSLGVPYVRLFKCRRCNVELALYSC